MWNGTYSALAVDVQIVDVQIASPGQSYVLYLLESLSIVFGKVKEAVKTSSGSSPP